MEGGTGVEKKKRLMETISQNFEEAGEIVLKAEYEESQKTEPEANDAPTC